MVIVFCIPFSLGEKMKNEKLCAINRERFVNHSASSSIDTGTIHMQASPSFLCTLLFGDAFVHEYMRVTVEELIEVTTITKISTIIFQFF